MNRARAWKLFLIAGVLSMPGFSPWPGAAGGGFFPSAYAQGDDESSEPGDDAPADGDGQEQEPAPEGADAQQEFDDTGDSGQGEMPDDAGQEEPLAEDNFDDTGSDELVDPDQGDPNQGDPNQGDPNQGDSPPPVGDISGAMVDAHARARAAVGVPPLAWSSNLAAHAQQWTDRLARDRNCGLEHRQGADSAGYGENLFATSGASNPGEVVGSWDAEKANYDAASNSCKGVCGHYTQVVWRNTTEVGCGVSNCPGGGQVWACNYNPPGNYAGERPF